MSISSSNRIENSPKMRKFYFEKDVKAKLDKMDKGVRKKRMGFHKLMRRKSATCTQCKRGMDTHLAKTQKQNKRENAPICIPCILGIKRKEPNYYEKEK